MKSPSLIRKLTRYRKKILIDLEEMGFIVDKQTLKFLDSKWRGYEEEV